ncbi:hypothetical protein EDC39_107133 [Geothermobacter ehrlichii]|uniref:HAMP domain-containing protein n=1 Tax=Geothermobacter ehrlichii TaxID=213224 RepID=A0A5D3WM19_9BACT|nr:methyl-accepting chemotaxis protein [Geothermobacter ehrlichii]TYO98332.1 hypothetical protein EDC39_107133 [Geothermobacter ehrlichii]
MSRKYRRRNFFINKELQGRFIFRYFILSFAGVMFFALAFSYLSQDNLTIAYDGEQLRIGATPMILLREMVEAHWFFLVTAGVFIAVFSMFVTHRIAGPLFRFEKTFEAMSNRDFSWNVVLRAKDEAKQTAAKLNIVNDVISNDLRDILRRSETLEQLLEEMQEGGPADGELLRRAREENQVILELLRGYRFRS